MSRYSYKVRFEYKVCSWMWDHKYVYSDDYFTETQLKDPRSAYPSNNSLKALEFLAEVIETIPYKTARYFRFDPTYAQYRNEALNLGLGKFETEERASEAIAKHRAPAAS